MGFGTTELHVLRARPFEADAQFLFWLSVSSQFMGFGAGSMYGTGGQRRVPEDFIKNYFIALPALTEQQIISIFLDKETAKIDALIEEQRKLIELLKEERQTVTSQAVTKGVNPSCTMKALGIGWLGNIPASWNIVGSRRLFRMRNERAWDSDQQLTASQKYGMLLQADFVELEGRRVVEVIQGTDTLRHVEPNDFVISLRSFQGGIEWSKIAGSVTFHYVVLTPIKYVHPPFFAYLFKSTAYIQALRSTTNLIRDGQDLRYSHFVLLVLPVVPMGRTTRNCFILG